MPIMIPVEPDEFWNQFRIIIREEIAKAENKVSADVEAFRTEGLIEKPLYKISELCKVFQVSRPTIYDWIKHGKLKPFKVRSRVFFLRRDIEQLLGEKFE